jgi:DNA-binding CsgD family transcriptional regulator
MRKGGLRRQEIEMDESPEDRPDPASTATVDPELVPLIRRLVAHASAAAGGRQTRVAGEPVLLDIEVEGVRCLLLDTTDPPAASALSPREQEIVRMVAQGYPNKTIAAVLDISSWTVSTYLRRIFAKLDVRSRAAMVARVMAEGLVAEPPSEEPERLLQQRLGRQRAPDARE